MTMYIFTGDTMQDRAYLEHALRVDKNYDLRLREIADTGAGAVLYYMDGFVEEGRYEKLMGFFSQHHAPSPSSIPCGEAEETRDGAYAIRRLLSGCAIYLANGDDHAILLDIRYFPERGVEEPDNDRVLRGARDGFVETLVRNTALLRRRIRDPRLVLERHVVGEETATDVLLCYVDGKADDALVERMRKRLENVQTPALLYGQESLAECLCHRKWYNPFPKTRYTERPDTCAAVLLAGGVVLMCDGTPSAMLLPVSIFDFLEESDDFYFPPLTAGYMRILRIFVLLAAVFLIPTWYLLVQNPHWIPQPLGFIAVTKPYAVPILLQLLLVEVAVDGLKLASLNTPSTLSSSFAVIGGLILGDFAVGAGWFLPEVILYMAVVTIAGFSQTSFELGYAVKFMRMSLLLFTALLGVWGLLLGTVLLCVLVATNQTVDGAHRYLYPFLPWDRQGIKALLLRPLTEQRKKTKNQKTRTK